MNKMAVIAVSAAALFCSAAAGSAQEVKGGFCKVEGTRVSNAGDGIFKAKLWEYTEAKLPEVPLLGWVDVACADRGTPRSILQDFGKRIYFNVAGPEGGAPHDGVLSVSDPNLNTGVEGETGIAVKNLAIYGIVTPRHVCAYEVWVWAENCQSGH
ncbi:MAG: hypothetical protein KGI68_07060 [Alphaproteobacteria bacterium]|nr:hypothetical protein [Alphaproteobacteria bacterium]MDE1985985.1 hypothetical protein [Alphaproteobacteria bacterium]MDE2163859.1 hypothetical protein [Alphaproteobacteria bacterium]MDE2265759.1 hypothetical protein [Alphaproteobacteria bacterium]MDE2500364.1 hypothetical protein [Alphaproteobacteria bacterium]